ncbi:hypothetical protein AB4344_29565, partial [Vibrio breoganii]
MLRVIEVFPVRASLPTQTESGARSNTTFNPETTTGGNALKFYTSVRLD